MSKSRLKKSHKGLVLVFILFFATILFGFLGFDNLSKILFYAIFPVFFWTYYHSAIFVAKFNAKAYNRLKNKQVIFTDSLSDDEDDPPNHKTTLNKDK